MVALASAFAVSTSVFDTQHRNAYVGAAVVLTLRSSGSSLIERLRRP